MAQTTFSFGDFVKQAFKWKVKVPLLGHLPMNYLLLAGFGILGVANPGFWLLGLGLEAGYLMLVSSNPRFQKLVRGLEIVASQEQLAERRNRIYAGLDRFSQDRYQKLLGVCGSILKNTEHLTLRGGDDDLRASGLNQLIWMFLKLLYSKMKIKRMLGEVSKDELETEIKRITERLAKEAEGSAIARSLQGTLEIQRKRQENLAKAGDSMAVLDAELDRIEKQAILLNEEASVSSDPDLVTVRLDNVMQTVQGTSKWMAENNELFGDLDYGAAPPNLVGPAAQKEG